MKRKIKKLLIDTGMFLLGVVINTGLLYLGYKFILILIIAIWIRIILTVIVALVGLELILRLLRYLLKLIQRKSKMIYAKDYGMDWAFTVSHGRLINNNDAVIFKCKFGEFAVNGLAKDMGYDPLGDLWLVDKVDKGEIVYKSIQPFILEGLKLRDPNADKIYAEHIKSHQELLNKMKNASNIN